MMEMLNDLPQIYTVLKNVDQLGTYKVASEEVNGEMLQTLSRIYWMTGDEKYLDWALKIGDYYLKENRDLSHIDYLRLRDHGCEVIGGLSELYVTLHYARPEIKQQYQQRYHGQEQIPLLTHPPYRVRGDRVRLWGCFRRMCTS